MIDISVILPVYNVEDYLEKSINSVLAQTFTNFELIVVVDGSPDNSISIAQKYAQQDQRIKVFEKANGGLSDARNFGLGKAIGDYIYFMDSDDWIEPNLLEDNIKILQENELDFLIFGYFKDDIDKHNSLQKSTPIRPVKKTIKKGNPRLSLDMDTLNLMGYAWNKIYRFNFLKENQLTFEKGTSLVEDILFNTQVFNNTNKIYFNEKCYYHYSNREIETLMKTFHLASFNLRKRRNDAISHFLDIWKFNNKREILSEDIILGLRYCIHNLFNYKNQLSKLEKIQILNDMLFDEYTRNAICVYNPKKVKDKIYFFLIKNKLSLLIKLLAVWKK